MYSHGRKGKNITVTSAPRRLRGNWGWDNPETDRAGKALSLSYELGLKEHSKRINEFISHGQHRDGRHFRQHYSVGGYEDMVQLHSLDLTIASKSNEFKSSVVKYLTYPENRFVDWEEWCDNYTE